MILSTTTCYVKSEYRETRGGEGVIDKTIAKKQPPLYCY